MVIAIDGPAGAGKGTAAKLLAKRLSFTHIDSGSLYRVVAFYVFDQQLKVTDEAQITALLPQLDVSISDGHVFSRGRDLTAEIRFDLISKIVSPVSRIQPVRHWVNQMVCHLAADRDVVVEGRDMTTIVFPQAEVKFYLDASLDERAHRRYLERRDRGEPVTLEAVKADIQKRDEMDKNKPGGALRRAAGAIYIDSTKLSPAEVVNFMLDKVKHYRAKIRKTV